MKLQIIECAKKGGTIAKLLSEFNIGNQTEHNITHILAFVNFYNYFWLSMTFDYLDDWQPDI